MSVATWEIRQGDVLDRLREMPDESVHCAVTSPPYWGLRDYGTGEWVGGEMGCDHVRINPDRDHRHSQRQEGRGGQDYSPARATPMLDVCTKCGATRQDLQLGLEATPAEYVAKMVEVFREVRRVLREDGTLWLNLGDSYHSGRGEAKGVDPKNSARRFGKRPQDGIIQGLKPKDLVGIPWSVAKALQQPYYTGSIKDERDRIWLAAMLDAEGCIFIHNRKAGQSNGQGYERKSDNYAPGIEISNTHRAIVERVAALVGKGTICEQAGGKFGRKQTLYRWNLRTVECRDFIREVYPHLLAKQQQARIAFGCPSSGEKAGAAHEALKGLHNGTETSLDFPEPPTMFEPGWYLRADVIWKKPNPMPESVRDRPTKAHEYVFLLTKSARYFYDADAIAEPASTLGVPNGEVNSPHGQGFTAGRSGNKVRKLRREHGGANNGSGQAYSVPWEGTTRNRRSVWPITTRPYSAAHFATFPPELPELCIKAGCPEGGTVLDFFAGSATTGLVALRLGRSFIGIELNPAYVELGRRRIIEDAPLFNTTREVAR